MELQSFLIGDESVTLVFKNMEVNLLRVEPVNRAITEYLTHGTFELSISDDLCDVG